MNLPPEFHREDRLPGALKAAQELAANYFPVTDEQVALQDEMLRAIRSGDLEETKEALRLARVRTSKDWCLWHDGWLRVVERLLSETPVVDERIAA